MDVSEVGNGSEAGSRWLSLAGGSTVGRVSGVVARAAVGVAAAAALVVLCAGPVWAAGGGYSLGGPPASATSAGFSTVVTAQSVPVGGGTVTATAFSATATVVVPSGSLPDGGEVVISAGAPSSIDVGRGSTVVADFSVDIVDPSTGQALSGPFNPPVGLTITDPAITGADKVVVVTGPGHVTSWLAEVSAGSAAVLFSGDPNFAVVAPVPATAPGSGGTSGAPGSGSGGTGVTRKVSSGGVAAGSTPGVPSGGAAGSGPATKAAGPSKVPGATQAATGEPFAAPVWAALVVVAAGTVLVALGVRRRRRAS